MAECTLTLQIDDQGRAASQFNTSLEFSTRIYETKLREWPGNALDALRADFTVADCALLSRTYFISSTASPRCVFEALALAIVKKHIPMEALASAGAEWWVQKRPNGRAEILMKSGPSIEEQRNHTSGDEISQPETKKRRQISVGDASQPDKKHRRQMSFGDTSRPKPKQTRQTSVGDPSQAEPKRTRQLSIGDPSQPEPKQTRQMSIGDTSQPEPKQTRQTSMGDTSQLETKQRRQISIGEKSQRIDWHFDKDEELQAGTGIVLAPQLSTVTYLSNTGGATVLLDCAAHPATGSLCDLSLKPLSEPASLWSCQIVRPAIGKHLCFDGRRMSARSVI